ncbi:MAG TPA: helix-turn-helix domain-containing protein [Opitutales bacterium]|nr:helix-turn-helix domain-containing protein [Opitutales bacterium]
MQSIGEKLEEARKRRGVSLREASEVLKIRSEYLGNFENNSFDLNVPEVYIRGFLRSYAEFLKLDGEKIITDFNAWRLGESAFVRQEKSRGSLGRMDLDVSERPSQQPQQPAEPAAAVHSPTESEEDDPLFNYTGFDRTKLLKGAGAIGGALVVLILVVVGIVSIFSSSDEATAAPTTSAPIPAQELTVFARGGDINSVIATEVETGQEIFRGPIRDGNRQRIPYDKQVELRFSNAQFLGLEFEGRTLKTAEASGPGRIIYPPN